MNEILIFFLIFMLIIFSFLLSIKKTKESFNICGGSCKSNADCSSNFICINNKCCQN